MHLLRFFLFTVFVWQAVPSTYASDVGQAKSLFRSGDTKAAIDVINVLLEQEVNNAEVHFIAGLIYGQRAQEVSMFSAPGFAKKTLKAFKTSVTLEPENVDYRFALMSYYFIAPGIMGGSDKRGIEQGKEIKRLDRVKGYSATAFILRNDEEHEALALHYDGAPEFVLNDSDFRLERAFYYQEKKNYADAVDDFRSVIGMPLKSDDDLNNYIAMYQLGRTGVLSGKQLEIADSAMIDYLVDTPKDIQLPSEAWAKFRWAQIKLLLGQTVKARDLFNEAKVGANNAPLKKALKKVQKDFQ